MRRVIATVLVYPDERMELKLPYCEEFNDALKTEIGCSRTSVYWNKDSKTWVVKNNDLIFDIEELLNYYYDEVEYVSVEGAIQIAEE